MEIGWNTFFSGSSILLLLLLASIFIWHQYKHDKTKSALLLIIVLGIALRIFVASDPFLHKWDERYHALVAKNTIDNPFKPTLYKTPVLGYDYQSWVGSHVWLHKQPMPLWTMAASMKVFGVNLFGFRLPTVLLSLIAIWLTFLIARSLFDQKVGLIAAYLHSINGLIIELTGGRVATDHIDVYFLVFIELAIWFAISYAQDSKRWKLLLIGVFTGFAILTKWLPALIVLPIFVLINYKKSGFKQVAFELFIITCLTAIISLPWQVYTSITFPLESSWEKQFNWLHLTTVLEGRTGPFYYFFSKLRIHYGEIMYIPFVWILIRKKNWTDPKYLALFTWILVPILFFSISKTKMQGYTLFIAPAVFIVIALFIRFLLQKHRRQQVEWKKRGAILIIALLFLLPLRYCIERVKPFSEYHRITPDYCLKIEQLKSLKENNLVIEECDYPIETMFFMDCIAYDKSFTDVEKEKLNDQKFETVSFKK